METKNCETLKPVTVENIVKINNPKNKVSDLWNDYKSNKIRKEEMEVMIKRRCIENINNWYFPKKFINNNLEEFIQILLLNDLISHNIAMKEYLTELINYANEQTEQPKIVEKIMEYTNIYREQMIVLKKLLKHQKGKKKGIEL